MKLLLENWRKYQLLTEAQDIHALYESGQLTEAEFMDKIKRFAKKKGIPIAVALSLATGGVAGAVDNTQKAWQQYDQDVAAADAAADAAEWEKQEKQKKRMVAQASSQQVDIGDYDLEPAPRGVKDIHGKFMYVPPEQIADNVMLDQGETAGELKQRLSKDSKRDILSYMSNKGGQMLGQAQDWDGDGYISDYEASIQNFKDTDEKTGLRILPLHWSVAYGVYLTK
jgi:hypothetical protein